MGFINSKKYDGIQLYIKKNKDISYYIRYKDENNKLTRVKIGDKSKGITEPFCKKKRDEAINNIKLGLDSPIKYKNKSDITFETVTLRYLDDLRLHSSETNIKDIKNKYLKHLAEDFASLTVDSITSTHIENLQKKKVKVLAEKTVNQLVEMFSTIFNYGMKKDLCKTINPATKVKRFKVDNNRERFLQLEEISLLYKKIKDNYLLNLFTKLSLTLGGRLETTISIKKKDIDISTKTVILCDFKNKDTYRGFLSSDIIDMLKPNLHSLKANDYILSIDNNSVKLTKRQIQCRLKPILDDLFNQELDIKDRKNRVVIHTLRHTFASHLAINGTPIFTIQKLMNHKDIKQTMRYAKLSPDSGRDFVDSLYMFK